MNAFPMETLKVLFTMDVSNVCIARFSNDAANHNVVRKKVTYNDDNNNNDADTITATSFKAANVQ